MKQFIYLLAIVLMFSACENDDGDSPQEETNDLNTSNVLVDLPNEIDASILSQLEVSNTYGNYPLNDDESNTAGRLSVSNSTEENTSTYNADVNFLNNDLMITNVVNQNGDMLMCTMEQPAGTTLTIDAEQTALTVLMTHPLLMTSNQQEYYDAVAYIKTLQEFETYKTQVEDAIAESLANQFTPNYAGLSGYKPVLMALLNNAFDNSDLTTPSLVRMNQPIQRDNGKLTFTITNEHKRVLHMYPKKVNVGNNGVTITSEEYITNTNGFPQMEVLEPKQANYWKIVTGSLMGETSSPFEITSEPIEVDIENYDKLYYEIYGLGKLSQPFNQYSQEEQFKILFAGVHGAYNDFIRPMIDLGFNIGEVRRASGADDFHYDLRYGSRTDPETQLILKLWDALKADTQTQAEIVQSLFDKDFTGAAQQLVVFCIDELFKTPDANEQVTYLNIIYNIAKKYSGISSTSDEFRDNFKKIANQITHVKNANFAGKVIKVGELGTDIAGAIYAYYNTEVKHTIIANREEEPYLTLLTPTAGQVFDNRGIVNFTWDFYRADLIGQVTYDFNFTVIEPDNTQLTYTEANITDNSFTVDLNNDVNTQGINNFYWQVIAKNAQNEIIATSNQFSFSIAQETPQLTTQTPTNITETSITGNAQITDQGATNVTTVGFCWSTSPNPTINDSFTGAAYTTDTFSLPVQGLQANTTYYLKAYAQNSNGTGYGNEIQFTTTNGGNSGTYPGETVFVQGGTFMMGSNNSLWDNERPVHSVTLSSFQIGKYEVTNAEYAAFLNSQGNQSEGGPFSWWYDSSGPNARISQNGGSYSVDAGYENHPVLEVSWYGARAYAQWVGGRLPTEAEWEYAARGGNQSQGYTYSGSNTIGYVAWYGSNSGNDTHPVGTKQPNELGIYDMSGSVFEWCNDWYDFNYYSNSPSNNPQGPATGTYRVYRGGSWEYAGGYCRVASRESRTPAATADELGFRLVFIP